MTRKALLILGTLWLACAGCAVHVPTPSPYTSLAIPPAGIAEAQLLDVAIGQFTFEPPLLKRGTPDLQLAAVRTAESRYMPVMLRHTLMQSGAFGAIHVLPVTDGSHDLYVDAQILESESHTLSLRVSVVDASGASWFERIYTEHVGAAVHDEDALGVNDPFDGLYNRIANDMLHEASQRDANSVAMIRNTADLQFGNAFAPDVYAPYLETDRKGITTVTRMPPASDPAVVHLQRIRLRDQAFHDILQRHYVDFARDIAGSYYEYRRQSYRELQELQRQQKDARNDIVGGAVLIGVAIATSNIDDALATVGAATTAAVGVAKVVRGVTNYSPDSPFFTELEESFSNEVVSETITLDEEIVLLSGSVESLYEQWKDVLRELFREDRRQPPE
ncbi:MAG TPA: hypothetical protein VGE69_14590 [Pseudomonadales bacterium]